MSFFGLQEPTGVVKDLHKIQINLLDLLASRSGKFLREIKNVLEGYMPLGNLSSHQKILYITLSFHSLYTWFSIS